MASAARLVVEHRPEALRRSHIKGEEESTEGIHVTGHSCLFRLRDKLRRRRRAPERRNNHEKAAAARRCCRDVDRLAVRGDRDTVDTKVRQRRTDPAHCADFAGDAHSDDGIVAAIQNVRVGSAAERGIAGEASVRDFARDGGQIDGHIEVARVDLSSRCGKKHPIIGEIEHDQPICRGVGDEDAARRYPVEHDALTYRDFRFGGFSGGAVEIRDWSYRAEGASGSTPLRTLIWATLPSAPIASKTARPVRSRAFVTIAVPTAADTGRHQATSGHCPCS